MTVTKDHVARVVQAIEALAKQRVLIGITAPKGPRRENESIDNASLGYIHEFGSPARGIPPRPFLVPGIRAAESNTIAVLRHAAVSAIGVASPQEIATRGLGLAGQAAQASVQRTIRAGEGFAPLAVRTLAARARKGFKGTKVLIQTGQLLRSITYVVRSR